MKRKNGFTLIELLVVIAIIAILAAILFPVFAQAREKARQISCVSNEKQIGLAILQYQQDYDEAFPSSDWWNVPAGTSPVGWPTRVQPYIKNLAVFGCPDDPGALKPDAVDGWAGALLSFAGNGYRFGWNAATSQAQPGGPFSFDAGTTWMVGTIYAAQMTRPSDTIMVCEHYGSDAPGQFPGINTANWPTGNVLTGQNLADFGQNIPDGGNPGVPSRIGQAYPLGPNGGVSAHHVGNTLADFLFIDGHVKSMRPTATDPDSANQPQNNMWDGTRM